MKIHDATSCSKTMLICVYPIGIFVMYAIVNVFMDELLDLFSPFSQMR